MEAMADTLIIHIGLPKTGTTMLQRKCFDRFDNTVTGNSEEEWKLTVSKGLYQLFNQPDTTAWDMEQGQKYLRILKDACSRTSGKPLLISRNIVWPNYFPVKDHPAAHETQSERFPVSLHLEALLKKCPWISKIKVILTLRTQPQWLASLYAQQSTSIGVASKTDFERQVHSLMGDKSLSGGGFLNWGKMADDLALAVGEKNVYVLLLEEISTETYWKTLAEATELPFDPAEFISISNEPVNVLNAGHQEWRIQERMASFNIDKYDSRFFNFLKHYLLKNPRVYDAAINAAELSINAIRTTSKAANPLIQLFDSARGRKDDFCLSEELAAEIYEYCIPFNQKLAEHLGRDLSELGY